MPTGIYKRTINKGFFKKGHSYCLTDDGIKKSGLSRRGKPSGMLGKKNPNASFKKGMTPWNKGIKGYKLPESVRLKMSNSRKGNKNPFWKGGITPENKLFRSRVEFQLWRLSIFERDKFTCRWCGEKGGKLNAHHIQKFINNPELRLNLYNGITLCEKCHNKTKGKEEKYEQLFWDILQLG